MDFWYPPIEVTGNQNRSYQDTRQCPNLTLRSEVPEGDKNQQEVSSSLAPQPRWRPEIILSVLRTSQINGGPQSGCQRASHICATKPWLMLASPPPCGFLACSPREMGPLVLIVNCRGEAWIPSYCYASFLQAQGALGAATCIQGPPPTPPHPRQSVFKKEDAFSQHPLRKIKILEQKTEV